MQKSGYLLLADVSGYTKFVTGTEAEHSAEIIESLIRVLVEETRAPFVVQEIEGDAVFSWATTDEITRGAMLLDMIESIYGAFRSSIDDISLNSTCTCRACASAQALDLKFVLHHGWFTNRNIEGHSGIGGADVILAHRLLKNSVREATGTSAYAFISEAAINAMAADVLTERMARHSEACEPFGDVGGAVYDLADYWARTKEQRNIIVSPEEAFLVVVRTVPVSRPVAWDVYTDPRHSKRWRNSDSVRVSGLDRGRFAPGTVEHCVHGRSVLVVRTLDWKPTRYVTQAAMLPLGGRALFTARFEDAEEGTRVTMTFGHAVHDRPVPQRLLRLMMALSGTQVRKDLIRNADRYTDIVREVAAREASRPS